MSETGAKIGDFIQLIRAAVDEALRKGTDGLHKELMEIHTNLNEVNLAWNSFIFRKFAPFVFSSSVNLKFEYLSVINLESDHQDIAST